MAIGKVTQMTDIILEGEVRFKLQGMKNTMVFMEEYNIYWQGDPPDTASEQEKINDMPYAIRSAVWFWLHYGVYSRDQGHTDVASVTNRCNGGNMGLIERQTAYTLCEGVFL